jgi:hypothetical protein
VLCWFRQGSRQAWCFVGSIKKAGKLGAAQDSEDLVLPQGVVPWASFLEMDIKLMVVMVELEVTMIILDTFEGDDSWCISSHICYIHTNTRVS